MRRAAGWIAVALALAAGGGAGAEFSDEAVDQAIEKASRYLLRRQQDDGSWRDTHGGLEVEGNDRQIGATSLCTYALLAKGMKFNDPPMAKALDWLGKQRSYWNYAVSLRCQAFLEAARQQPQFRSQLARDVRLLLISSTAGKKPPGSYGYRLDKNLNQHDPSNGQYGVLGAWAGHRQNLEIPRRYWLVVMEYWKKLQERDGGWKYRSGDKNSTGSMTAAGVATLFVCVDALYGKEFIACRRAKEIPMLKKGLDWFDRNFVKSLRDDGTAHGGHGDHYYYLFGVERVGLACGYKYFGKADWYQRGREYLLSRQGGDGAWNGKWGKDVATAYALLFLIRGRHAVLFNWLEYDGAWNNRPRGPANFCRWAHRAFESDVNWQIINLRVNVSDWHDAPALLITGNTEPKFSDGDLDKLRTFVRQGGTLVSVTECNGKEFEEGIRKAYGKLFGGYELKEVPADHPLYTINARLRGTPKMYELSNGVRPLAIHTDADLTRDWQLNNYYSGKESFDAAANLVMYITDRQLRHRGAVHWPGDARADGPTVEVVRLKHKGNWNPEPLALERFSRRLAREARVNLKLADPVPVEQVAGHGAKLAVLTGTHAVNFSDAEVRALKKYVEGGGTLLVDAAGGAMAGGKGFAESAELLLDTLFGRREVRALSTEADLLNLPGFTVDEVSYSRRTRALLSSSAPRLWGAQKDGRTVAVFSRQDLTTGLLGLQPFGIDGYTPDSAYRIARNVVLLADASAREKAKAGRAPGELVRNGGFEGGRAGAGDVALHWDGGSHDKCSIEADGVDHYLRVKLDKPEWMQLTQRFDVRAGWKALKVSARTRARDASKGKKGHEIGRVQFTFRDAKDKVIGGWPKFEMDKNHNWTSHSKNVKVPDGAKTFLLEVGAANCTGTYDFDDISVVPVTE